MAQEERIPDSSDETQIRILKSDVEFLRNQAAVLMLSNKLKKAPTIKELIHEMVKSWESLIKSSQD